MIVPAMHLTATLIWGLLFGAIVVAVAVAVAVATFESRGRTTVQAVNTSTKRTELRRAA